MSGATPTPSEPSVKTRSALALAGTVVAAVALYLACRPGPAPAEPRTLVTLLARAERLGLTRVPSVYEPPSSVLWLVRDPNRFVEPQNLSDYRAGAVRVRLPIPGSLPGRTEFQVPFGDLDLLGDMDLIRQLVSEP